MKCVKILGDGKLKILMDTNFDISYYNKDCDMTICCIAVLSYFVLNYSKFYTNIVSINVSTSENGVYNYF